MSTNYRNYLIEFFGTFLLIFTIGIVSSSTQINTNIGPFVIGLSLILMIIIGGYISGGYYNPAVSIAMLIQKKLTFGDCIGYILSQITAAFLASYIVTLFNANSSLDLLEIYSAKIFFVEFFFTFLLVFSILSLSIYPTLISNIITAFAVGIVISIGGLLVGNISGASFNPAVAIHSLIIGFYKINNFCTVIFAIILGALVASFFFSLIKYSLPEIKLFNNIQEKEETSLKENKQLNNPSDKIDIVDEKKKPGIKKSPISGIRLSRKNTILRTSD